MRGTLASIPRRSYGHLTTAALVAGCGVLLFGLVALAVSAPAIAVGLAVFLTLVLALGFERAGTVVMILALFLAPMNSIRLTGGSSSVTASDILFVVAAGLLTPTFINKRLQVPTFYLVGVIGLVVLGANASLLGDGLASLFLMSKFIVSAIVIPIVFMWWRPSLSLLHKLATAYVAGAVISVFYSLTQVPMQGRVLGLTTHVNNFGHASMLALLLLPFVWSQLSSRLRPAVWMVGFICFWGIWSSGSRAALLVVAVLCLLFPFLERSGKIAWMGAFTGALGLLFFSRIRGADQQSALGRLFGGGGSVNSDNQRVESLQRGWEQFREHPIRGQGFVEVITFHNIYLAVAVAVGVFGLIAMLALLWSAVQPIFLGRRPYGLIAYAALGYALFGMLSTNLWDRFVWIVLSMVLAARMLDEYGPEEPETDVREVAAPPLFVTSRPF